MSKSEKKNRFVIESATPGESDAHFFANEFRFTKGQESSTIIFGYSINRQVVSTVVFVVPNVAIESSRASMVEFYDKISQGQTPAQGATSEYVSLTGAKVYYGNVLDASQFGEIGQMRLCFFPIRVFVGETGGSRKAKEVASVDMSIVLLLAVLREMFF